MAARTFCNDTDERHTFHIHQLAFLVQSVGGDPLEMTGMRDNVDVPFSTERETRFCPGVQGGVEWNGPAYHPGLGLAYVNAIDWCTLVKLQPMASIR